MSAIRALGKPPLNASSIAAGVEPRPFLPYDDSDDENLRVSIREGVVFDRHSVAWELSSLGPVTITATRWFFLKITTDAGGEITDLDLHDDSTLTPSPSDTVAYRYIGKAIVDGGQITAIEEGSVGNQNYRRVGFTGDYSHLFEPASS